MGALYSHAFFLIVCESNADGAPLYVDPKPNTTASRWGNASVRRSIREDAAGEQLHYINLGSSTRSLGSSIRTCRRFYYRNIVFSPLNVQAKETATLSDRIYTILAVTLLQTLGLFHQHSEQRSTAMTYHAMLVTVSFPISPRLDHAEVPI